MSAAIVRFNRPEQIRREVAEQAVGLLHGLDLPERVRQEIVRAIDRHVPSDRNWTFLMISPEQFVAVSRWIADHSRFPHAGLLLWNVIFEFVDGRTGEVMASRDELASAARTEPVIVSKVMTELERIGAISRRRVKIPGMKGPGRAVYFLNPTIATSRSGVERDRAQREAPKLRLVNPDKAMRRGKADGRLTEG